MSFMVTKTASPRLKLSTPAASTPKANCRNHPDSKSPQFNCSEANWHPTLRALHFRHYASLRSDHLHDLLPRRDHHLVPRPLVVQRERVRAGQLAIGGNHAAHVVQRLRPAENCENPLERTPPRGEIRKA